MSGTTGDWDVPPNVVTAPPFANPLTDPSISLGTDVPPELVAWANLNGIVIDAVMVYRHDATTYYWEADGTFGGLPARFRGSYDATNGVVLTQRTIINGGPNSVEERIGSGVNTFYLPLNFIKTDLQYESRSLPRGLINRHDDATLNVGDNVNEFLILNLFAQFDPGRAYALRYHFDRQTLGGFTNMIEVKIRKSDAGNAFNAAIDIQHFTETAGMNPESTYGETVIVNVTAGVIQYFLVLTGIAQISIHATAQAQALNPAYFGQWDIGAAVDYPNALQIT